MSRTKIWITLAVIAMVAFLVFFLTPRENSPSGSTRVILEHNHRTYIAPSCFEQADATNFIEESDLEQAIDSNYLPNSKCTEEAFKGNNDSYFTRLMKELGVFENDSVDW